MSAESTFFRLPHRGVIEVTGSERIRWLDGMLTADVQALEKRGPGAGCHALLLTRQGRIVADPHVLADASSLWLELESFAVGPVIERLDKLIIADDVQLADASERVERLALEGPGSVAALLAVGVDVSALEPEGFAEAEIAGVALRVAAYAFTGGPGFQLFVPAGEAGPVASALEEAGASPGSAELLERLRIEAGTPWLGRELDETVLPAEAGLDHAVSTTKGCYTGQEVVARLRSRDRRNHVLVGLHFEAGLAPAGSTLHDDAGKRIGEVTSSVASPRLGDIGLGYVRHEHALAGTAVRVVTDAEAGGEGAPARVAGLPFAAPSSATPSSTTPDDGAREA